MERVSFFFNDASTTEIYTLSLLDARPIFLGVRQLPFHHRTFGGGQELAAEADLSGGPALEGPDPPVRDRKSTRLNSSHANISYAVFCLKKKERFHRDSPSTRPPCGSLNHL